MDGARTEAGGVMEAAPGDTVGPVVGEAFPRRMRRKTLRLDQTKLDRLVELSGAASETDAVARAIDLVLFREELLDGIRHFPELADVENLFD